MRYRSVYVTTLAKSPLFAEYDYLSQQGLFFLRLSHKLMLDQAPAG